MKANPNTEMGNLIRVTFRESGLSIKQLAERSGVPYASVHGVVAGKRDPALSTAERLCRVLGLQLVATRKKRRGG